MSAVPFRTASVVLVLSTYAFDAQAQDTAVVRAVDAITSQLVRERVLALAHDSMAGRDTPSPQLDQAAAWVASEFRSLGLVPGGDAGSFIQRFPLQRGRLDVAQSRLVVGEGQSLLFGRDVAWVAGARRSVIPGARAVVVSGAPDLTVLQSTDLAGTTVILLAPTTPRGQFAPEAQRLMATVAQQRPALIVLVAELADSAWERYATQQKRAQWSASWQEFPVIVVAREATLAQALLRSGVNVVALRATTSSPPITPTDVFVGVTLVEDLIETAAAPNVVGILRGSDPLLRDEALVISAHMDHIGVGGGASGCVAEGADSVCNGADDNASGTAAVMAVAHAFTSAGIQPRRSIVFLIASGEESGLRGSDFFGANSPVPIAQVVANINADNIGRGRADAIGVIGMGDSDLGEAIRRVSLANAELRLTPLSNPMLEDAAYSRSDHYSFARRGVPFLFFTAATHEDYHRVTDDAAKIDVEKLARVARLIFLVGLDVATTNERPKWNPNSRRAPRPRRVRFL